MGQVMTYLNEDTLVQQTTADYLRDKLGWDSVYAHKGVPGVRIPLSSPVRKCLCWLAPARLAKSGLL